MPAETCFIGLGSNLNDPARQLDTALKALGELGPHAQLQHSRYYRSAAIGPGEQPDYLNAVARLETTLEPLPLLRALQRIEQAQDRVRGERWAARTLDLDLLLYGDDEIQLPDLTVPHPRMRQRGFVLLPLLEIAPDLHFPDGTSLAAAVDCVDCRSVHPREQD